MSRVAVLFPVVLNKIWCSRRIKQYDIYINGRRLANVRAIGRNTMDSVLLSFMFVII